MVLTWEGEGHYESETVQVQVYLLQVSELRLEVVCPPPPHPPDIMIVKQLTYVYMNTSDQS